jgi:DNA-binding NtrC family response regulator
VKTVLVVDDDHSVRRTLQIHLSDEGYRVLTAADGAEGLAKASGADVVLLDLRLPKIDGFEVLRRLRSEYPRLPVVVITAYDDMDTAIEAIRLGALDHLGKPVDMEHLDQVLQRAAEMASLSREGFSFCEKDESFRPHQIVGRSRVMKEVFKAIGSVADSQATVLLTGESGTGKELVARAIHFNGRFRDRPFVAVACSALAPTVLESELFGHEKGAFTGAHQKKPGKFELAQGGTLFLDEVSEISLDVQVKLLRFLQEREFERVGGTETLKADVRVIAATNRPLGAMLERGQFRQDLYYRLQVMTIELPPLRERRQDIPLLVHYFLEKIRRESGRGVDVVPKAAMELVMGHPWPGNVRELENAIRRAVLLSGGNVLLPQALEAQRPAPGRKFPLLVEPLHEIERSHIENILAYTGGEKKRAAEILRISRPTLDKKIQDYGIALALRRRPKEEES